MKQTDKVVCLPGLWVPRGSLLLLQHRLKKEYGYEPYSFSYRSIRRTLDENAVCLAEFIAEQDFDRCHLIGHSLGGVVVLRALALRPGLPVDRIVCLGSPLCGSQVAKKVSRHRWGTKVVGKSIAGGVIDHAADQWAIDVCKAHEVGVVAGTVSAGLGLLVNRFDEENDGTVTVSETRLPGIKDHVRVATGHSAMAVSRQVARQVGAFLGRGAFDKDT